MQHSFEQYLERLSHCVDEQDFCETMHAAVQTFKFTKFAYVLFAGKMTDDPWIISNYPDDWAIRYRARAYHAVDPVLRRSQFTDQPFLWRSDALGECASYGEGRLLEEAADFGISRGLTIPILDRKSRRAAVTFAADAQDERFFDTAETFQQALQLMATCFHVQVRRKRPGRNAVEGVKLTKRELECLRWAARGKSARDTAEILGIKPRTVSFHLDNARNKFDVRTVTQLITILATSHPELL